MYQRRIFNRERTRSAKALRWEVSGILEEDHGRVKCDWRKQVRGRVLLGDVLEVLGGGEGGPEPCWLVRTGFYSMNEMGSHCRMLGKEEVCLTCTIYVSPDSWVLSLFWGWKPVAVMFCCCSNKLCGTHSSWLLALRKCPSFYPLLTPSCLITFSLPQELLYFSRRTVVRSQGLGTGGAPCSGVPASGPHRTELGNLCRMPTQS